MYLIFDPLLPNAPSPDATLDAPLPPPMSPPTLRAVPRATDASPDGTVTKSCTDASTDDTASADAGTTKPCANASLDGTANAKPHADASPDNASSTPEPAAAWGDNLDASDVRETPEPGAARGGDTDASEYDVLGTSSGLGGKRRAKPGADASSVNTSSTPEPAAAWGDNTDASDVRVTSIGLGGKRRFKDNPRGSGVEPCEPPSTPGPSSSVPSIVFKSVPPAPVPAPTPGPSPAADARADADSTAALGTSAPRPPPAAFALLQAPPTSVHAGGRPMGGSKAAGMRMPRGQPQLPTIFQPAQPVAPAPPGTSAPVAPDVRTARAESSPLTGTLLGWANEFVGHVTSLLNPFLTFAERSLKRSATEARDILVLVEEGRANLERDFEHHRGELANLVAAAEQKAAGVAAVKEVDLSWVCSMANGNAFCDVCSNYVDRLPIGAVCGRARRSRWIKANGGVQPPERGERNRGHFKESAIGDRGHDKSALHLRCIEAKAEEARLTRMETAISRISEREQCTMERLFKVLHNIVKRMKSNREYEEVVHLVDECDGDVGDKEHSRKTLAKMVHVTRSYGKHELRIFFGTVNPLSNSKPRLGLAADKMTDASGTQSEIVNGRYNYLGRPITVSLDLVEIDDAYAGTQGDAEVAEAGGFACFQKIIEVVEDHGIILFEEERDGSGNVIQNDSGCDMYTPILDSNGQNEQISCFVADGEAVYKSEQAGVNHYLHSEDGLNDPTIHTHHDLPHSLDLLKADAQSDYTKECHTTIKAIWSHFSQSPKRYRQLMRLVERHSADFLNLHYLFEVRGVRASSSSDPCIVMCIIPPKFTQTWPYSMFHCR